MSNHLIYGQHPKRSMPLASWPKLSRVGSVIVVIGTPIKIFYRAVVQSIAKIAPNRVFDRVRPTKE
jgi:hypothetical protein